MTDEHTRKALKSIQEWKSEMFQNNTLGLKTNSTGYNPVQMAVLLANRSVNNLRNNKDA